MIHILKIASCFGFAMLPIALASAGTTPAPAPSAGATASESALAPDLAPRPCICLGSYEGSDKPFSFNISTGYDSTFFCRGMDMGDDLWWASATIDVNFAENFVWTVSNRYLNVDESGFEENHLYTGLFFKTGIFSIGPSFRWYHNFEGGMMEDAYDLGLQSVVELGPVNLSGGYYYETETEGHYFEFGAAAPIKITDRFSLVPAAEISYTDGWMMPGLRGWNTVTLRLSAPVKVTEIFSVIPWIGANLPLDALDDHQDNKLVGGVALSATF